MLASSPRNGASTLLNTTAEESGDVAEELSGTEAIVGAGSSRSLRMRRGLLVGALLLGAAAAAALLLGAPWATEEQVHHPHGSGGLQPALRSEQRFGLWQLSSEDDEEQNSGDDQDDEEDGDGKDDDDEAGSADDDDGEDDEADGDDEEEEETTTSTMTTMTTTTEGISANEEAHDPHLAHVDKDGDGKISSDEWHAFVDSVRNSLSDIPDEVDKALKDYYDGGELNYHELDVLLYHLWFHSVENGFKQYDKNGDGLLEKNEIKPYAKELEHDFGLSPNDFNDVFDLADTHEQEVLCAKQQDITEEWKWDECTCLTPGDSKLSLCEVPGLLHAINLHFKKLEKS